MVFTVGVDVGGPRKGFHAVAFRDGSYHGKHAATDPQAISAWCRKLGAVSVGVDAPCCWSNTGRQRCAERQLSARQISCFATPSEEKAHSHPEGHYNWMVNGARLFNALAADYQVFTLERDPQRPVCFETFPQAIACALAGQRVSARQKRQVRRSLLARAGVDISALSNIDFVDAALCALTAARLWDGKERVRAYGDRIEGFILVPRS